MMNEAMPHRLVPVLREFLCEHVGAREVSVLLADYELQELRLLSPGDGEQLILPQHRPGPRVAWAVVTRDLPARQLLAHTEPRSGTARREVTSGGVPSDETLGITVDGSA